MIRIGVLAMIILGGAWWVAGAGCGSSPTQPATQPSTQPTKELTLDLGGSVTMKLVLIPAGTFTMGSPDDEEGRYVGEGPQRQVTISQPFYMGVTEVTEGQYQAVMVSDFNFKGSNNPQERVSWNEAREFCQRLSQRTGKTVRLPTEAQWEYACRAGTQTRFGFEDSDGSLGDYAWFGDNSDSRTHPVGQKQPNAWGLYDMHGNMLEWCSDWYASYANASNQDPPGPGSGTDRVQRGGDWFADPRYCRAAHRSRGAPYLGGEFWGFRVVVGTSVDLK